VDCLALAGDRQALALLDKALQRYWITLDMFVAHVRSRTGTRGAERLRRFVRIAASGTRSDSERLLVQCCARAGLSGWEVNATVVDAEGRPIGEFDVVIEYLRLAIEADGWAYHSDQGRFQHDRTKQNAAVRAGWTILRFTWSDLRNGSDDVIQTIRATAARLGTRRIP
jgi:very-short-patch-repair endonuclease